MAAKVGMETEETALAILTLTKVLFFLPTQTVADVIRTCLGPKAMLKMILDPMGGIL